jgi:nondiscriminating aspartyl-tRNA synthetase
MNRTFIGSTPKFIGKDISIEGFVNVVRDHGKITFFDLYDRTGLIQCVGQNLPKLAPQDVVSVTGKVVKRPEKLINEKIKTGMVEMQVENVEIKSKAEELPFDMAKDDLDVSLPVLLDYRALTLRHPKVSQIFRIQAEVMEGFRNAAKALDCVEIFVPTVSASSTEGGAEVFKVDYYGHEAFMIQSPQLYKQMLVPVFERVFLISHAYRSEPSVTTRHLSESIQMDCELGFVEFDDLLDAVELVGKETIKHVAESCEDVLRSFNVEKPKFGKKIPRLKMREAQEIIKKRTKIDHTKEPDLMPEDEREICAWALEEYSSDLVTITHYPTKKRAFYTLPDPADPEFSLSYDLLFKGVEILSGSQRIVKYPDLVAAIKNRGMDPNNFEMYLQAFKYGMPPEGGFSFGLERITMQLLGLANIREASLFPRDMERVDFTFASRSVKEGKEKE